MREILFKGFAPNENGEEVIYINDEEIKGDWVFGNLEQIIGENVAFIKNYFVLRGTVSQFTGLLDKNGNKVFENDVVKFSEKYDKNKMNKKGIVQYSVNSFIPIIDGVGYTLWHFQCEVIGNRWEKE